MRHAILVVLELLSLADVPPSNGEQDDRNNRDDRQRNDLVVSPQPLDGSTCPVQGAGESRLAVEEAPEIIGEVDRRSVASRRSSFHRLEADRLEVARDVGTDMPRVLEVALDRLPKHLDIGRTFVGAHPASSSYRITPRA